MQVDEQSTTGNVTNNSLLLHIYVAVVDHWLAWYLQPGVPPLGVTSLLEYY